MEHNSGAAATAVGAGLVRCGGSGDGAKRTGERKLVVGRGWRKVVEVVVVPCSDLGKYLYFLQHGIKSGVNMQTKPTLTHHTHSPYINQSTDRGVI